MSRDRDQLLRELGDVVRASQRATDVVDELVAELMGVNRTDGRCLDLLEHEGRMSAGELARASGLTTGAITGVIDRLERAGYAQRVADPADRRRVLVEPTELARRLGWELFGRLAEQVEPRLAKYTDEQLEMLIEFQRDGRVFQEEHAQWLRERLAARGPERPRPASRTGRG